MTEHELVMALRDGKADAFRELVMNYQSMMVRVASGFVPSLAIAEEVVQDTWIGVINGIGRFEERSSLKTWIFRILVNRARTRGQREHRNVPFDIGDDFLSVDPERFKPADDPLEPRHWLPHHMPSAWPGDLSDWVASEETMNVVKQAIDELPGGQRTVITMRDLQGLSSSEVCDLLEISEVNQRVLLHRARSRVRGAIERYFDQEQRDERSTVVMR
jgi:RNA polymerase sigma-70 factor (ECF subfamily)